MGAVLLAGVVMLGAPGAGVVAQQGDPDVARAEAFVRHLERGEFALADSMLSPEMRQAGVNVPMLEQTWAQLTSQGALAELMLESKTVMNGLQVVDFAARFGAQALKFRVVIDGEQRVSGFRLLPPTPPAYQAPAYVDTTSFEEVAVTIGEAPWQLGGTLTLPKVEARAPVVVLVHGSGPHDRDETLGPNRPFRDLAWGLGSQGVAVLRYDKRTWVHGARMAGSDVTVENEVIADALAALAVARAHARVDAERVYLLGHSLGGKLAPEIAVRDGGLAGVVLLAGTPRGLPEVVLDQLAYLGTLESNAGPEGQAKLAEMRTTMEQLLRRELHPDSAAMGAPASYFYDLMERSPLDFVKRLDRPVLVLQGGRDYQVTRKDFELWRGALAGREHARFELYEDLNHLFMPGTGTATPEEYGQAGSVDERVIRDIAQFMKR